VPPVGQLPDPASPPHASMTTSPGRRPPAGGWLPAGAWEGYRLVTSIDFGGAPVIAALSSPDEGTPIKREAGRRTARPNDLLVTEKTDGLI
jgi:hypothetical protein